MLRKIKIAKYLVHKQKNAKISSALGSKEFGPFESKFRPYFWKLQEWHDDKSSSTQKSRKLTFIDIIL